METAESTDLDDVLTEPGAAAPWLVFLSTIGKP